ncbi:MAG TPA: hypothetical protein VLN73_09210, partial [Alphaproteobacteria bacterium]|nr:hypothetical protein [Alphaproteobacteria bacterium]
TGITSVGLQVIGAEIWGLMGVAAGAAAGFIFISVFAVVFAAVRLGFDSTGLTLVVRYCRDHLYSTGRPDDRRG